MAFDKKPSTWLGPYYAAVASTTNSIAIKTIDFAGAEVGTDILQSASTSTGVLTTSADHGLSAGNVIQFVGASLPTGLTASTNYVVLTTPLSTTLTVGLYPSGSTIVPSQTGTGKVMLKDLGDVAAELTDSEANATTGDIRKLLFALCEHFYQAQQAQLEADRPTKMVIYRSTSTNDQTEAITKSYQFVFNVGVGSVEVVDE
jgi:hypothetical protein